MGRREKSKIYALNCGTTSCTYADLRTTRCTHLPPCVMEQQVCALGGRGRRRNHRLPLSFFLFLLNSDIWWEKTGIEGKGTLFSPRTPSLVRPPVIWQKNWMCEKEGGERVPLLSFLPFFCLYQSGEMEEKGSAGSPPSMDEDQLFFCPSVARTKVLLSRVMRHYFLSVLG